MKRMYEKSLDLESAVLQALDTLVAQDSLHGVDPRGWEIVCPEFRQGTEDLDHGEGWHDLSREEQRVCQVTFACMELQSYLERITGVRMPIVSAPTGKPAIELQAGDAQDDGFEVERDGDLRVVLSGENPRSLLYAVYHFLEAQGCRWYGVGEEGRIVPEHEQVFLPEPTRQTPSFPLRYFHGQLENRATYAMLDWFAKNRLNTWGADNDRVGQRRRGIEIFGGNHWLIHEAGFEKNFDISDREQRGKFLDAVTDLVANGRYRDVDYLDYIGEDWGNRVDSPGMANLGIPTDQDVFLLAEIQKHLDKAHIEGKVNRRVRTWGWAYYDTIEPPAKPLPEGFEAKVGIWSQFDPRFAVDDPASDHSFEWPRVVTAESMECIDLPTNIELWRTMNEWPCQVGMGDYHAMARNFFLPVPFVTVLADTIPKLADSGFLYYSFMHIANGSWGLMQPMYYLMARMLWDARLDVPKTLAEYFHDLFGEDAPAAVKCLFSVERAMLQTMWMRSHVAKRLMLVTLHGLKEPFWMWGDFYSRKEMLQGIAELEAASEAVRKLEDTPLRWLWETQIEYADAMWRLYFHAIETYESAREFGLWHFCRDAARHLTAVGEQLRRLAGVDLTKWLRNIHYYPRSLKEQTLIAPALESMSRKLGIPLPEEVFPAAVPAGRRGETILSKEVWRHGDQRSLKIGLGNYQWFQPYVDDKRVFLTGRDKEYPDRSVLRCLDIEDGSVVWEVFCEDSEYNALHNVYMGLDRDESGRIRNLFVRECHKNPKRSSALVRIDADSGREVWRYEDPPEYPQSGNGGALVLDLDGDGRLEVIDSAVAYVVALDLDTGKPKWRFDDRIQVCHGITAVADIDGDGRLELILGGEYNEPGRLSSVVALKDDGSVLWRSGGYPHDLGSTRTHVLDVDGDGRLEILHSSLELLGMSGTAVSELYCWNADGTLRYRAPLGGREISLADFDGDGRMEAISITSGRDGGHATRPAIVCLDAASGTEKWRIPIPRHYLDDDLRVVADFDGDGLPETLLFTAHQSGYGHIPGQPTWCDAYIVKGTGEIIRKMDLGDMSYAALIGTPEKPSGLIIASGDGLIRRLETTA